MAQKRVDLRDAVLFVITSEIGPESGYVTTAPPERIWGCVQFGEGNFTATINDASDYVGDRGKLDDVRFADEAPMDISFEGKFVGYRLPPYPTSDGQLFSLTELITGRLMDVTNFGTKLGGLPEPWLIADSDGGDLTGCIPYCSWLELHLNPMLSCPDVTIEGEAQLYRFFRAPTAQIDLSSGQLSITGNAHGIIPMVQRIGFEYTTLAGAAPLDADEGWVKDPREWVV